MPYTRRGQGLKSCPRCESHVRKNVRKCKCGFKFWPKRARPDVSARNKARKGVLQLELDTIELCQPCEHDIVTPRIIRDSYKKKVYQKEGPAVWNGRTWRPPAPWMISCMRNHLSAGGYCESPITGITLPPTGSGISTTGLLPHPLVRSEDASSEMLGILNPSHYKNHPDEECQLYRNFKYVSELSGTNSEAIEQHWSQQAKFVHSHTGMNIHRLQSEQLRRLQLHNVRMNKRTIEKLSDKQAHDRGKANMFDALNRLIV